MNSGKTVYILLIKAIRRGWIVVALNVICCCVAHAQAPVITPKNQLVFKLDKNSLCTLQPGDVAMVTSSVTADPVVTISPNTFNCSTAGKQTVTITARNSLAGPNDASNVASKQVDVIIAGTPLFAVYDDVILTADENCKANLHDYTVNPRVVDLCPGAHITVTQVPAAGSALEVNKTTTVTLTAHDDLGGASAVFFTVTSLSKPVITPVTTPIRLKLDQTGAYTIKLSDLGAVSSCDNGTVTTTISPKSVGCSNVGTTTVTLTASTAIPNPKAVTFSVPTDVVTDAKGNLYIADGHSCKIREISVDGIVTTYAGGDCGFADGKLLDAKFQILEGLTIDPQGNIYVVESNNRVRKITTDGMVSTLAGSGASNTVDGRGLAASFRDLRGITIDLQGNLFVTQGTDNLVRKVTPAGDVTTVTKPANISNLYTPTGIVADAFGNLYVTDFSSAIKKITPDGNVTIFAGHSGTGFDDGKGLAASFNLPKGIIFDNKGDLYVTDSENNAIRRIDPAGNVTTLDLYLKGTTDKALLSNPVGIKMDNYGNFIVVDSYNERIVRFTPDGQFNVITGNGVAGSHDGNANTPPTIGNKTVMSFQVTVASSQNSTIPQQTVVPSVTVTPQNATVCAGDPVSFTTTIQPADAMVSYQWLVNGVKAGNNSPVFTSSSLHNGDIVNCITGNPSSCILPQSTNPVTVHINPLPTIAFPGRHDIKPGNSIQLQSELTDNIVSYQWSPASGLSDATIANPIANPEHTTDYQLTVTTSSGCQTTGSVTVNVIITIEPPNTFTPNGDGFNDVWEIGILKYYPRCYVAVYNRNGQVLFQSKGYGVPWDGTYKGSPLASGTYYYMIAAGDGIQKPVSGWVMIAR